MKLSFAALATLVTLGLSVSASPAPQAGTANLPAFPFENRPNFRDMDKQTAMGFSARGEAFDDTPTFPNPFRVNRFIVTASKRIHSVQVNLSGPNGDINNIHGGTGGDQRTTIDLAAGERVINLKIWVDRGVAGLAMTTSQGRTFNCGTQDGPPGASYDAQEMAGLIGFHGNEGLPILVLGATTEIVAIGPIFGFLPL